MATLHSILNILVSSCSLSFSKSKSAKTYIRKIVNVTGQKVIYVGHSRGATNFFMAASEKPQLVEKLVTFGVNLSPAAYLDLPPLMSKLAPAAPYFGEVLKFFRIYRFFYNLNAINRILVNVCFTFPHVCRKFLDVSFGQTEQFLPNDLLLFYGGFPSTVSVPEILQFAQIHTSGNFSKYNYGKEKNLVEYGQEDPPKYDMGKITVPVALFYGENDNFVPYKVANRTFNEIGALKKIIRKVPETGSVKFNHIDFIFGKDVKTMFYDNLVPSVESLLIN